MHVCVFVSTHYVGIKISVCADMHCTCIEIREQLAEVDFLLHCSGIKLRSLGLVADTFAR